VADDLLRPRFPDVALGAGHYESIYLTAHHPTERRAVWIRHTVLKEPGAAPTATLWCTWFGDDAVRRGRITTDDLTTSSEWPLGVGDHGRVNLDGAVGGLAVDGIRAAWDLRFEDREPPMRHLPKDWMYTAKVPRTKSMSAVPMLSLAGSLEVEGAPIDLTGWRGSIGHNWGSEHAERWVWLRASGFSGDPDAWLDMVIGRVRLGPVVTPWLANGSLSLDGRRHRLGGIGRRGTRVEEAPAGARIHLPGADAAADVTVALDLARCVGWHYESPADEGREVVNSSVADIAVAVTRRGGAPVELRTRTGAYEIGAPERAIALPG
jgi:hypothetical protein